MNNNLEEIEVPIRAEFQNSKGESYSITFLDIGSILDHICIVGDSLIGWRKIVH